MLRNVQATRYVTPFREGGSLPGLLEGDDEGLYVVKFRGAGQGLKALIAEVLVGELARTAGLNVPELVTMELDEAIGRNEPDPEIRELLIASTGSNAALDFLPGSVTFDPASGPPPSNEVASRIVLFDAFTTNIDRTPKNPNLLVWHKQLWLIDHGACIYAHHGWEPEEPLAGTQSTFAPIRAHVLLPWATELPRAAESLVSAMTPEAMRSAVAEIPEEWLEKSRGAFPSATAHRENYEAWLDARIAALPGFLAEAERARE